MASYQEISFPNGWFNTYPQTQPSPTQHVPKKSKKVKKGVHATNKTEQPQIDLLQQVWLGLLSLAISISSDESGKNPKASKQKQAKQANKQANKNPIFPKTGKSKKSKVKNTVGSATGITPKEKCTICKGPHSNLMYCSKLTQYLPFGNNQLPPPVFLCLKCLSTKHWNAKNCNHMGNRYYKNSLCPITKKHYLMCTSCEHHLPAIRYMSNHHEPCLGYKNFSLMKQCFGDDMFKSMNSICNACKGH